MDQGFWKNKRVFVTGHTGFKGSWLVLWLKERGATVCGYGLAPHTTPNLFELAKIETQIESVIGNICDLEKLKSHISKFQPEIVFHMAAQSLVRPSYRDPVETYATNVMGTVNLLEAVRATTSVRSVVVVTSDKCYENKEWAWGYRESEPMGGADPYSSSKGCAELVVSAYRRSFFEKDKRVGIASARAGNVIGGGDWSEDRLIPDCVRSLEKGQAILIRNPNAIRPWQHVLEPLHGYMQLAEKAYKDPIAYSQGWNFGPDVEQAKPVKWIADHIVRHWSGAKWQDASDPNAPHEAMFLKLDSTLARTHLDWQPRLNLESTLEMVMGWYRSVSKGEPAASVTLSQIHHYQSLLES